uniref:ASCH domain-containing protein n=1 Tax=Siphoviridae sp. ctBeL15 TaxID=2825374 RepID=A0A8S5V053_9CAUD|nr:MAG TPA: hypothetical protein [Siphoviridae sp. ctBeL15]
MKAVLISIRPKWCEKIANGEKTIEVRKTRPKLEMPFKCYIYCTKAKERLVGILKDGDENYGEIYHGKPVFIKTEKGSVCDMWGKRQKVIGEFVCDRIDRLVRIGYDGSRDPSEYCICNSAMSVCPVDGVREDACLTQQELEKYLGGCEGYGWHISDLKIYDTPRELGEFTGLRDTKFGAAPYEIKRAPQSWCYVEEQK